MKRLLLPLLTVLLCTSAIAQLRDGTIGGSAALDAYMQSGTVELDGGGQVVAGALFVKLKAGAAGTIASSQRAALLARAQGLSVRSATPLAFSTLPDAPKARARVAAAGRSNRAAQAMADLQRIVEVQYDGALSPQLAARMLMRSPDVEYAEPIPTNVLLGAALPNDPLLPLQPQVHLIKADSAWSVWQGDTSVTIAIIDAGIDNTHEDLFPNIQLNWGEYGTDAKGDDRRTNRLDDDGNGVVDDWSGANLTAIYDGSPHGDTRGSKHGTQVSGMAAAATNNGIGIAGIAYRCRFFPIKASLKGSSDIPFGYEGLIYAAKQGYQVANCSWGTDTYSQANQDIINDLVEAYDMAIVAGGGNGYRFSSHYPSGYRHVLGVSALDSSGTLIQSVWGDQIGVASPPGFSTDDNNQYIPSIYAATSYTTPIVSGVVALVRSRWPSLSADQALAHVRLTADNIDAFNGERARLVGYGRINAYRAVSVDPFSHPALEVDSLWTTRPDGAAVNGFRVGEKGMLHVRLRNLLGDAHNLHVRVAMYASDSPTIAFAADSIVIPSLASNAVISPDGLFNFTIALPSEQLARLRFDFTADGGYRDYRYARALIYQPYETATAGALRLSLSDHGRLGYEDYPDNRTGDGITVDDIPYLFEGGFIIATDAAHVISNVRGADVDHTDRDFVMKELPNQANDSTLLLSDEGAEVGRRIGLEMRMRIVRIDSVKDALGIELRTRNVSGTTFDSLRVAMFCDWDLNGDGGGQLVSYVETPEAAIPYQGIITGQSGATIAQGVAGRTSIPIFFPIRNGAAPIILYNNFTQEEKWATVAQGVAATEAGPSDISLVIGRAIPSVAPGDEDTTLFVIGNGDDEDLAIDAIRRLVSGRVSSSVSFNTDAEGSAIGDVIPYPADQSARISLSGVVAPLTLRLYDSYGRLVAQLDDRLRNHDGSITIDVASLPNGLYHLQLGTRKGEWHRPLMVVHR